MGLLYDEQDVLVLALQQDVAVSASEVAFCKISTNCAKLSVERKTRLMKFLCYNCNIVFRIVNISAMILVDDAWINILSIVNMCPERLLK